MGMTNRKVLRDVIDNIKPDGAVPQELLNTLLLTSIANSLAVIADVLTDKKGVGDGDDD